MDGQAFLVMYHHTASGGYRAQTGVVIDAPIGKK
jgi:hypothetical protein